MSITGSCSAGKTPPPSDLAPTFLYAQVMPGQSTTISKFIVPGLLMAVLRFGWGLIIMMIFGGSRTILRIMWGGFGVSFKTRRVIFPVLQLGMFG
jgi:hypothetical protein